jgi:mxaJ protein
MRAHALALLLLLLAAPAAGDEAPAPGRTLRVCADPNNLPFSNAKGEGLENRLAELLAHELGAKLEYTWWAQRRGFFRNTLKAGLCDVVMGVPQDFELALTTKPYYRSSYVFVSRKDAGAPVRSFDDPRLRKLRIGVHVIGDDASAVPPAHALGRRGIVDNVRGYSLYGDYRQDSPPQDLLRALERREVDVAIVWGPLAGYYAKHSGTPLHVVPVSPQAGERSLPFAFDISLGVRRGQGALKAELEHALARRRRDVQQLLADYGVPRP